MKCTRCGSELTTGDYGQMCWGCRQRIESPSYADGWRCPRCLAINAPSSPQCRCVAHLSEKPVIVDGAPVTSRDIERVQEACRIAAEKLKEEKARADKAEAARNMEQMSRDDERRKRLTAEREVERLRGIIGRAMAHYVAHGDDDNAAHAMFVILREAGAPPANNNIMLRSERSERR